MPANKLLQIGRMMCAVLILLSFAARAQAGNFGVEYGAGGTLGTGFSLSYSQNERFSYRLTNYSYEETKTKESIKETSTLKYKQDGSVDSKGVIVNFHPFGGKFYLAGGMYQSDVVLKAYGTGTSDDEDTGSRVKADIDVGVVYDSQNPYLGFGWSRNSEDSGFGIRVEFGVFDIDRPEINYSLSNFQIDRDGDGADGYEDLALTDTEAQELQQEIDDNQIPKLQKKAYDLDQHTILDLTISYHF